MALTLKPEKIVQLHVAGTRARDFLLITGVEPASEFLDDLRTTTN